MSSAIARSSAAGPSRETILVVEDDLDGAKILRLWLEHAGYCVLVAHCGIDAVAMAHGVQPDLILLDVALPDLDGFATAARIRAHRATRNVPIVALTALALPDGDERARRVGLNGYLFKPVRLVEILETIESVIRSSSDVAPASRGSYSS